MYTNSDSIMNKKNEFSLLAATHEIDLIMVTEVLPKNYSIKPQNDNIRIEGYEVYSNLDEGNSDRGVAIYVSEKIRTFVTSLEVERNFQ